MTVERNVIKTAPVDDFRELAVRAAGRLLEALDTFGAEVDNVVEQRRRKRNQDIASVVTGAAVAVASVAIPVLSVPAAVFGVAVGNQSIRGLVNEFLAQRTADGNASRPLGILYRLRDTYGGSSA